MAISLALFLLLCNRMLLLLLEHGIAGERGFGCCPND